MSAGFVHVYASSELLADPKALPGLLSMARSEAAKVDGRLTGELTLLGPDDVNFVLEDQPENLWVLRFGVEATVNDTGKVEVYRDTAGEWRWRLVAGNGETIADSSEGYTRRWSAKRAARGAMPGRPIIYV